MISAVPFLYYDGKKYNLEGKFSFSGGGENFSAAIKLLSDWVSGKEVFYFQTSGSTGTPKTLAIERDQMLCSARATIKALELEAKDVAWVCLNCAMIAGAMMLIRAQIAGMDILLSEPSSRPVPPPGPPPTFAAFVPMQLLQPEDLPASLRVVLVGGSPLSPPLKQKLLQSPLRQKIVETFAMTETVSHFALRRLGEEWFWALPGVSLDSDENGCLLVSGEITHRQILKTHDIVELTADKKGFRWIGRADNVINSGGLKIHPETIESQIAKATGLSCFATSVADERLGEKLVLAVEPHVDLGILQKQIATLFDRYYQPKAFVIVERFPLAQNGKILRAQLRQLVSRLPLIPLSSQMPPSSTDEHIPDAV